MGLYANTAATLPVVLLAFETSVVQRAIEIEAASVVAGHKLDQVSYPGVACPGKTRESHKGTGSLRQKHPLFAPGVKHRGMVNLVVIRLCGGCECRGDGVVPHTLLAVRLLVETEKR